MTGKLPDRCLDQIFQQARTHNAWRDQGIPDMLLHELVDLTTGRRARFDNDGVDAEFFAGTNIKSNFLCSLGYGDPSVLFPRSPRFAFDETAKIL